MNDKEKAKAYDEVLRRARTKLNEDITQDTKNALLTVFPELGEDKTERMKKSLKRLIEAFYDNNFPTPEGFTRKDLLDWLEKQGEQCKYGYIQMGKEYKCLVSPRYTTFKAGNIHKPEDTFIWSLMNLCHDCFELVDGEQESMPKFKVGDWVVSPNGVYWHIDAISNNRYEVSSVTGECTDWPLNTDLYHRWSIQDANPGDIIATLDYILIFKGHLEKEGGTSYCHYDFGADNPQFIWLEDNNWYFGEKAVLSPATKEQRDLLFQKMGEAGYEWDSKNLELRKTRDIFRKGNWYQCTKNFFGKGVTFDKDVAYYCAEEGCLQDEYGCHIAIVKDLYDNFKLWTIEDAKPGDMLSNDHHILILKELGYTWASNGKPECLYAYCGIKPDGNFELEKEHYCFCGILHTHPATKEQRDLLFQKMNEAGYEWDSERLELKRVEQKPAEQTEEDESMYTRCLGILGKCKCGIPVEKVDEELKWFKSLKDKVIPQLKQKWTEEDKQMLKAAISFVEHSGFTTIGKGKGDVVAWLKSLQPQSLTKALQEANKMISELINENNSLKEEEWTKEDEENLTYISAALDAYYQLRKERNNTSAQEKLDAAIEWLDGRFKSIKPKLWSPEDIDMLEDIINDAEQHCHLDLDQRDWLKNIKERALWRPSEEQLKALECVIQEESTNSELIKKLYNELSKL